MCEQKELEEERTGEESCAIYLEHDEEFERELDELFEQDGW